MRHVGSFFSVAITTPFFAFTPSEVLPELTACSAYSICTSLPEGLNVVKENEYAESPIAAVEVGEGGLCRRQAQGRRRQSASRAAGRRSA